MTLKVKALTLKGRALTLKSRRGESLKVLEGEGRRVRVERRGPWPGLGRPWPDLGGPWLALGDHPPNLLNLPLFESPQQE